MHDAVTRPVEEGYDLLIADHHGSQLLQLDATRSAMRRLGQERIAPHAKTGPDGQPAYRLPGSAGQLLPCRGDAKEPALGQVVDLLLNRSATPIPFERVYATDIAEGLQAMALEGHRAAFLPYSAVRSAWRGGSLACAAPPELQALQMTMDIRARREQPSAREAAKACATTRSAPPASAQRKAARSGNAARALWAYLRAQAAAH